MFTHIYLQVLVCQKKQFCLHEQCNGALYDVAHAINVNLSVTNSCFNSWCILKRLFNNVHEFERKKLMLKYMIHDMTLCDKEI